MSFVEWYMKSGTNICYIAYAFQDYERATLANLYFYLKRIIKTKRIEYVANEAYQFILNVRQKCIESQNDGCFKNMSQLVLYKYFNNIFLKLIIVIVYFIIIFLFFRFSLVIL